MKIHEFQAKDLLRTYQVPVPPGGVAGSADEAEKIAEEIGGPVVVKAQIHAGGRGKGGGIRLADGPRAAGRVASEIIGMRLVTAQTGGEGQKVNRVLVEAASEIEREFYIGITLDRSLSKLVVMASREGGVEVEKVASERSADIIRETVDPGSGLLPFQAARLAFGLGLESHLVRQAAKVILGLYEVYQESDCSLVEVNPLILSKDGRIVALDAKISIDDNALFRHKDLAGLRDLDEEEKIEVEAARFGLNYVKLDGNIGCMVNGAGLAMATMDLIKLAGGRPANFLDVGGGASAEMVENGIRILLSDPSVRGIFVNIFGGIVRCDRVAEGVILACEKLDAKVPIMVRLAGTNADIAHEMLKGSGLNFLVATDLEGAAEKIISSISG